MAKKRNLALKQENSKVVIYTPLEAAKRLVHYLKFESTTVTSIECYTKGRVFKFPFRLGEVLSAFLATDHAGTLVNSLTLCD